MHFTVHGELDDFFDEIYNPVRGWILSEGVDYLPNLNECDTDLEKKTATRYEPLKNKRTTNELSLNNAETQDDNEFNNNQEALINLIAGDCVNQLDVCKKEEKIFYEKPKLNIQVNIRNICTNEIIQLRRVHRFIPSHK